MNKKEPPKSVLSTLMTSNNRSVDIVSSSNVDKAVVTVSSWATELTVFANMGRAEELTKGVSGEKKIRRLLCKLEICVTV